MMCGHCVKAVTMALDDIAGVSRAEVSLERSSATVTYDDSQTDLTALKAAVVEEGYSLVPVEQENKPSAEAPPVADAVQAYQTVSSHFAIQGMSCANCAAAIEKIFKKDPAFTLRLSTFPWND